MLLSATKLLNFSYDWAASQTFWRNIWKFALKLLKMQFMSLTSTTSRDFDLVFHKYMLFFDLINLKTMITYFFAAIEKLKRAQLDFLSTKYQPFAAKTSRSVSWALPVTSFVTNFRKNEVGVLNFSWFVDLFTVWRLFGVYFVSFLRRSSYL